ncbi:hypothetical protein SMA90_31735, partial [Escherichia coli]
MALEALGTAPDQTLKWQADPLQDDPNAFLVTAAPEGEDRGAFTFLFDRAGRVYRYENLESSWQQANSQPNPLLTKQEEEDLAQDLQL